MKLAIRLLFLMAIAFLLVEAPPASAQQRSAQPPAKKAKKVWTNEDLTDIRKPWDEYTDQKIAAADAAEAARAQEAANKAAAATPEGQLGEKPAAGTPAVTPAATGAPGAAAKNEPELSVVQLEDLTNAKSGEVQELENALGSMAEELTGAAEGEARDEVQKRIAAMKADLEKKRAELKDLEAKLEKARAKNPGFQRGYIPND